DLLKIKYWKQKNIGVLQNLGEESHDDRRRQHGFCADLAVRQQQINQKKNRHAAHGNKYFGGQESEHAHQENVVSKGEKAQQSHIAGAKRDGDQRQDS